MNATPRVSVIVAAYNAATTIGATISGLLTQTYPDVEIIVVDDGSTDDTATVVAGYGDRVVLIRQENEGPACRNAGIARATGELIAWCDADDVYLPECVAALVRRYLDVGAGRHIVYAQALLLTTSGVSGEVQSPRRPPTGDAQRMALLEGNFVSSLSMYPRIMHDEIGPIDSSLRYGEDRELWIRAVFSGYRIVREARPVALYRLTGGSLSSHAQRMHEADLTLLRTTAASKLEFTGAERDYLRLRLEAGRSTYAMIGDADEALRQGDDATARDDLALAASLLPSDRRLQLRAWLARSTPGRALLKARLARADARRGRIDVGERGR